MFTFSFGSAFAAYTDTELQKVVDSHEGAVKAIQDKYDENLGLINADYLQKLATPNGNEKDAWTAACDAALETAKSTLNTQLAEAWNALATEEAKVTDPVGWDLGTGNLQTGYVDVSIALGKLTQVDIGTPAVDEAAFNAAMNKTLNLVKNYNLDKFVKDDDYQNTGKSSYETAVKAQSDALAKLATLKFADGNTVADIEAVYKIEGVGTLGEKESGTFYDAIKDLKTVTSLKTDEAKIAYTKNVVVDRVKSMIEASRAADLKVQNDIIFAQSIASKPNQSIIDKANEEIEKINKKYDAYLKVWTYRLENGKYEVNTVGNVSTVVLTYDNKIVATLGTFNDGVFDATGSIGEKWATLVTALPFAQGEVIVGYVEDLEKEAADYKATITVDGNTFVDVDEALADAIEETYMTGIKASLSVVLTNSVVHARAHQLLGTDCSGATKTDKVTVSGKKYDNVGQWTEAGYSKENTKSVKAIKKDAKEAIMAATSVADVEAAFLAAYEKYDAVLTTAEQTALFAYNGSLYKKDVAAKAELKAYIEYKVALLDMTAAERTAAISALQTDVDANLLTEVNNEADLNTAVAEYKAIVDGLKTTSVMKEEDKALRAKIVAVSRPVTITQKAEVIALYDEYLAFDKYCTQVGYTNSESDAVAPILVDDVKRVASLEKDAMDDIVKAIEKDGKVTLEDRANVEALVAAMEAYNALYPEYATLGISKYTTSKDYEKAIFELDVKAAEALISALPADGATASQIKAAKDAVEALGFKGTCALNKTLSAKLNRLDQNLMYEVESLKITASSKAAKGSMTINWKVKGDASGVEAFEIWKSTKKSSGFKKSFTTTNGEKRSYKNTKELKKGTRYYYKVRAIAYDANGKKITSDWSNKAYRIAK